MKDAEGNIIIVDWKRSEDIRFENDRCPLKPPLQHLTDCNYWLYSLQLNVYRYILETEYAMPVSDIFWRWCTRK